MATGPHGEELFYSYSGGYWFYYDPSGQIVQYNQGGGQGGGFAPPPPPGGGKGGGSGGSGGGGGPAPPFLIDVFGQKYSKAGFEALAASYKHYGAVAGVTVTDAMAHTLAKQGVSPSEFQTRLGNFTFIRDNKGWLDQYQRTLDYLGIKGDVSSFGGALKFITGQSEQQFYRTWDLFATEAAAGKSGYTLPGQHQAANQDLQVSLGTLNDIVKKIGLSGMQASIDQLTPVFQQAAQWAIAQGGANRFKGYGLTDEDYALIAAGQGSATKKATLQRLINEAQAFTQARVEPTEQQVQGGGRVLAGYQGL